MQIQALSKLTMDELSTTAFGNLCIDKSDELVVFGSRASGLESLESDIDILCIGKRRCKLKTPALDLNMLARDDLKDPRWLGSELASHIAKYGVWIRGEPSWTSAVRLRKAAIEAKRRRLSTFLRVLPLKWEELLDEFRQKYAVKLRREAQRLLLLEFGQAIPPTRLLDEHRGESVGIHESEVLDALRRNSGTQPNWFEEDLVPMLMACWKCPNVEAYRRSRPALFLRIASPDRNDFDSGSSAR